MLEIHLARTAKEYVALERVFHETFGNMAIFRELVRGGKTEID